MKKILFHINSMGKGGAERVVAVLAKYFANDGYEVVLTTQWEAESEYEVDKKVRRISVGLSDEEESKGRIAKIFIRINKYRQVVKKEKPDIVISFCAKANFRSAYTLTGLNIPLLVSVRNDPKIDYEPYKLATKYMQKKASGCVFQTKQAQSFFDNSFQEKSKIILNPLSDKFVSADEDINVLERKKVIVTVGRITEQKNQALLVSAFANIYKKFPEYQLWIFGGDSKDGSKEKIEKIISDNEIANRVIFKGLSNNIRDEIKDASIFVLPSDYEGMPNSLLEAMSIGLPVIATDCPCGGPDMMIQNEKSGLLVPIRDRKAMEKALVRLLEDKAFAEELGKEAIKIKDITHPDYIYKQWKEYVDEILG